MSTQKILFVAAGWFFGCHAVPSVLDDYCHETPMAAECPEGNCSGPYECIAYCVEHYPEHSDIPASGTGAWCDDLGTPSEYGSFCSEHPEVEACTTWCANHPGVCTTNVDGDADADSDGDGDGDTDGDGDGDGGDPCGDGRCESPEDAQSCPIDCPAQCGDGHITHHEQCEPDQTQPCTTTCDTSGTQHCGTMTCLWSDLCSPPDELCDGIDQNCDGTADEGCPCAEEWVEEELPFEGAAMGVDVWGSDWNDVYALFAVGEEASVIIRYDGSEWSIFHEPEYRLLSLWGTSSSDIFAVGSGGAIIHYDGTTWDEHFSSSPVELAVVWGNSPDNVFAGGQDGTILRYNGTNWAEMASPPSYDISGMWGSAPDDVHAVGGAGVILHYDGASWVEDDTIEASMFNRVRGSSANNVVAVGSAIGRYDGSSWSILDPYQDGIVTFDATVHSEDHIIFVGHRDTVNGVVRLYDGGSISTIYTHYGSWFTAIWSSSAHNVFITGWSGADQPTPLLHRCGSGW